MSEVVKKLFLLADEGYADFQTKLTPGIPREKFIGVRVPEIKILASEMIKNGEFEKFISELPHEYYDEDMLHSAILSKVKDYHVCLEGVESFLPYIDNWAVCDCLCPSALKKDKVKTLEKIREWMSSDKTYTCRFGIKLLMSFFLDKDFKREYAEWVASIRSEEYYVNMMVAWYFATALAKQYEEAITFLERGVLPVWVHNKTITKAIESYRISDEKKDYLRSLRKK